MASSTANFTNNFEQWDFATKHVQQNSEGSDFVGSHSVLICATYPRLEDMAVSADQLSTRGDTDDLEMGAPTTVYPIGLIDSSAVQQDRNVQQIFEIGSIRSYLLSARTITMLQLNRVIYNGPSMLRCLYAYYPTSNHSGLKLIEDYIADSSKYSDKKMQDPAIGRNFQGPATPSLANLAAIKDAPGYDDFWMNLASDLFSHPMGLVMYVNDNDKKRVAAMYFEECYVQNHSFQMSANSVVMAESCTIRCDKMRPVRVIQKAYAS